MPHTLLWRWASTFLTTLFDTRPICMSSGATHQRLLEQLFHEDNIDGVLFSQDAVMLKGSMHDDSRNFVGSLFLIERRPVGMKRTAPVPIPQPHYIVWLPYSYLFCLASHLLSQNGRRAIDIEKDLPLLHRGRNGEVDGGEADEASIQRMDWGYTLCIPVSEISKLIKKSNMRGRRVVSIVRRDTGTTEAPLIFEDGGQNRLFDELKKICTLKTGKTTDEYLLSSEIVKLSNVMHQMEDETDEHEGITGTGTGSSATSTRSSMSSRHGGATPLSPGASHVDANALQQHLYDEGGYALPNPKALKVKGTTTGSSVSRKLGNLFNTGFASIVQAGRPLMAQAHAIAVDPDEVDEWDMILQGDPSRQQSSQAEQFDVVEPIQCIESLVPVLRVGMNKKLAPPLTKLDWRQCFINTESSVGESPVARDVGTFPAVDSPPPTYTMWRGVMSSEDQLRRVRIKAYNGCIADDIRGEVWAYLLGVFEVQHTEADRKAILAASKQQYDTLVLQWSSIFPEQEAKFGMFREHKQAIMKDVMRTDRQLPEFRDENSPMLATINRVLMSYAMLNFDLGYCQGMSDVVSVLLLVYQGDEIMTFTVFKKLMADKLEGNFRRDVAASMASQLRSVQDLVKKFSPELYEHLERHHASEMMFTFRWLIILFKREFDNKGVMKLWDVIFASPHTPQFEIFLVVGILINIGSQILDQSLTHDEILKFTNSTAMQFDVKDVITLGHEMYNEIAKATHKKLQSPLIAAKRRQQIEDEKQLRLRRAQRGGSVSPSRNAAPPSLVGSSTHVFNLKPPIDDILAVLNEETPPTTPLLGGPSSSGGLDL